MLNIKVALEVWKYKWKNKRIQIHCDNSAVVEICNTGKTKDKRLGAILREIQMIRAQYNINLQVTHVYVIKNTYADALSRVHMKKCQQCIQELLYKNFQQNIVNDDWLAVDNQW